MLLPFTIQFHLIVALLASMCGDYVLAVPGPVHDDHAMVVLAEDVAAADHVDTDPTEPEGPSGEGVLTDVRIWSNWLSSSNCELGASPFIGDTVRRWLTSRAPPADA